MVGERNIIIIQVPDKMLKTKGFSDFRDDLFELMNKWRINLKILNKDIIVKIEVDK